MKKIGTMLAVLLFSSCYDACYSVQVEGKVIKKGSRMRAVGEASMEERIALTLNPYQADLTSTPTVQQIAEGTDGLTLECLSTRCATLESGECIRLYCRRDWRFMQPDVVECKLRKTIRCGE